MYNYFLFWFYQSSQNVSLKCQFEGFLRLPDHDSAACSPIDFAACSPPVLNVIITGGLHAAKSMGLHAAES